MSRRNQIQMTDAEARRFVSAARTLILCSIGPGGVPHPMPMWFGVEDDGAIVMTTFTKSQKVRNLERDPRVSLLVEDGEEYAKLRGIVMYGEAQIVRGPDEVLACLERITVRNADTPGASADAMRATLRRTAAKRVALRVRPGRVVSWDHSKLGGVY